MAPTGVLERLKSLYTRAPAKPEPLFSLRVAVLLSILCTLFYVVPLFLSRTARPSATVSRDAPAVIKARVRTVTISTFLCSAGTYAYMVYGAGFSLSEALRQLGWWPIGFLEICKSLLLVMVLLIGTLFERGIAEGEWEFWIQGSRIAFHLSGWIGYRNYVAGPITEEVIFRSLIVPIHLMAHVPPSKIVFTAPLYFGIAHIPHLYEFRLTHPDTSWTVALLRTLVQFCYTTLFGWFATFLYLRTGSLPAVIVVHSFCNFCGLPRFWGRLGEQVPIERSFARGKEDSDSLGFWTTYYSLGYGWTVAYYFLLVAGAVSFYSLLWPLTESSHQLASFGSGSS